MTRFFINPFSLSLVIVLYLYFVKPPGVVGSAGLIWDLVISRSLRLQRAGEINSLSHVLNKLT